MKRLSWLAAALLVAVPALSAQRTVTVSAYAGGADHLADLTSSGSAASFAPGTSFGFSVGLQLDERWAVHGDFTFTKNHAWGATPFRGEEVNRFFYGAHVERRFPIGASVTPFAFLGIGAVSIDQLGLDQFRPATRPAVMYGGGAFYGFRRTRLEVFGEVKGMSYRWNMAGFDRTMIDVAYDLGLSYRFTFNSF